MIIGRNAKPGLAAHLTGSQVKSKASVSPEHTTPAQTTDRVVLSTRSGDRPVDIKSQLRTLKFEVRSQEKFLKDFEFVPNQVLVRLKDDVSNLAGFAQEYGGEVLETIDTTGLKPSRASAETLLLLDLKQQLSVPEAMVLMGRDDRVSVVESNDIVRAQVIGKPVSTEPNDLDDSLWGLHNHGQDGGIAGVDVGAKQAWQTTVGSRTGPVVAVIDSGVDITHQDLKDNIFVNKGEIPSNGIDDDGNGVIDDINGYNAADDSTNPSDDNGHGTHVAGIIGAVGNNGKGITGLNQEAQILPVKFLAKDGSGNTADAIKSLVYASRTGARIVNNSWGGNKYNQLVFDVLADSKALHVCAAGNEAYDNDIRPVYPASYELDNILSVTAHDRKNEFPRFANRGEKTVDLAAPGVDINSTLLKNKYGLLSGTSMAAPFVSGAAALIATAVPGISNEDIKFRLLHNLDELPEQYGSRIISGGRLNVGKALEQDTVPPAAVGNLKLEFATPHRLNVSWLAPGDDGMEGRASAYEVRYTLGHFDVGDDCKGGVPFEEAPRLPSSKPKKAGDKEAIEFELTPSGKTRALTLGVVGIDNVINKGPLQTISVEVPAAKVAMEDRGESPEESAFEPSEHWGLVPEPGRGMVYTDSPGGDYPPNRDAILLAKPLSLKGFKNPVLHFDAKVDVEKKHDQFTVEIEKDGWFGKKWTALARYDGISDWTTNKFDLRDFVGKDDVKIRFRMKSDHDRNRDGVYLDNIVIAEADK